MLTEEEKIIYSKRFPRIDPLAFKAAWEEADAGFPAEPSVSLEAILQRVKEDSLRAIDPSKAAQQQKFMDLAIKLSLKYEIDMDIRERFSSISVTMYLDCASCSGELKGMFAELLGMSDRISSFIPKYKSCDFIIALDCYPYIE